MQSDHSLNKKMSERSAADDPADEVLSLDEADAVSQPEHEGSGDSASRGGQGSQGSQGRDAERSPTERGRSRSPDSYRTRDSMVSGSGRNRSTSHEFWRPARSQQWLNADQGRSYMQSVVQASLGELFGRSVAQPEPQNQAPPAPPRASQITIEMRFVPIGAPPQTRSAVSAASAGAPPASTSNTTTASTTSTSNTRTSQADGASSDSSDMPPLILDILSGLFPFVAVAPRQPHLHRPSDTHSSAPNAPPPSTAATANVHTGQSALSAEEVRLSEDGGRDRASSASANVASSDGVNTGDNRRRPPIFISRVVGDNSLTGFITPLFGLAEYGFTQNLRATGNSGAPPDATENPFLDFFTSIMSGVGTPGDYAFSQRRFDEIVSQLMEQYSNNNRPPPAADEVIRNLPIRKIKEKDVADHQECAICTDEFQVDNTVQELPCKHIFHPECICSWLKINGTCPICRYSFIKQPKSTVLPDDSHE